MRSIGLAAIIAIACNASPVFATNCENIIKLARVSTSTVITRSEFQTRVDAFCNENQSSRGGSGGISIAGYGLTGQYSSSNLNRYCEQHKSADFLNGDYENYVESIAPGAFTAYETCSQSTEIDYDLRTIDQKEILMVISFRPRNTANLASIQYDWTGDGLRCEWKGQAPLVQAKLNIAPGQTIELHCKRDNYKQSSSITVFRTDGTAPNERITIPWGRYDDNGVRVDAIADLRLAVSAMQTDLWSRNRIEVYQCPTGWNEWPENVAWLTTGCVGQLSVEPKCNNFTYKNNIPNNESRTCEKVGRLHLYDSGNK